MFLVEKNTDPFVKQLAESILIQVFGSINLDEKSSSSKIQKVGEILSQISLLGQIYSRTISLLATEERLTELLYKLSNLQMIGMLILPEVSIKELSMPPDLNSSIKLDQNKFQHIQEQLRPIKKEKNKNINTIEGIFQYILDNSRENYNTIRMFISWPQLLSYIFGTDIADETKGAKNIEQVNIKELLLSHNLQGPTISEIFLKYDGLLTYTMSLLTMLANTPYNAEFMSRLNKILESVGSSTQIVIFQGRIIKTFSTYGLIEQKIAELKQKIRIVLGDKAESLMPLIEVFLQNFHIQVHIPHGLVLPLKIDQLPGYEEIQTIPAIRINFADLSELWQMYHENLSELLSALGEVTMFLESVIRSTNLITAELFARGFQATLPIHDVELCEEAGIHLKNLTATSSTLKAQVSELDYDIKQRLIREFEEKWTKVKEILSQKSIEESSINITNPLLSSTLNLIQKIISDWNRVSLLNGFNEETIMVSRILFSFNQFLTEGYEKLLSFQKIPLNNENLPNFIDLYEHFTKKASYLLQMQEVALKLNEITKKLWSLNRETVQTIAEDMQYLANPEKILLLIADIPQILKQEYQQKLIPTEIRNEKLQIYNDLEQKIHELEKIPSEHRRLIASYALVQSRYKA